MKQKRFFIPILQNAWSLTWQHKFWWLVGFFALFMSGVLSFQVIAQGITALAEPSFWWERWQGWAQGMSSIDFFSNQWAVMSSDPKGWGIMILVWSVILLLLLLLFSLSVYSIAAIVSAAKLKFIQKTNNLWPAFSEAIHHFKGVFWTVALALIASNVLVVIFSLPIILLGVNNTSAMKMILLLSFFFVFLVLAYTISMMALFTIMHIVIEDYNMSSAIINSWKLFTRYWFVILEMFAIQLLLILAVSILTVVVIALFAIPVIIVGFILVSNQLYDVSEFLPQLVIYIVSIVSIIVVSAFTLFQLTSWANLFMSIEQIRPQSRLVQFIELQILAS